MKLHKFWEYNSLNTKTLSRDKKNWIKKQYGYIPDNIPVTVKHTQHDIHLCTNKIVLALGGNQSGKSTCATIETIIRMTGFVPFPLEDVYPKEKFFNKGGIIARVIGASMKTMEGSIIKYFQEWVPPQALIKGKWTFSFNESKRLLTLLNINGEKVYIEFRSSLQKSGTHVGTKVHLAIFDEVPPKSIFQETISRLLSVNDWRVMIAATPVEASSNWIYNTLSMQAKEKNSMVSEFKMSSLHNTEFSLSAAELLVMTAKEDAIRGGSDWKDYVNMRLFADQFSTTGFVYKGYFNRDIHVIPAFPIDYNNYMVLRGLDPHPKKDTVVLEVAIDKNDIGYVCGCYNRGADIDTIKRDLAKRVIEKKYRIEGTVIDSSINYKHVLWDDNPFNRFISGENAILSWYESRRGPGCVQVDVTKIKEYLKEGRLYIFDLPELSSLIYILERIEYHTSIKTGASLLIDEQEYDTHACLRMIVQRPWLFLEDNGMQEEVSYSSAEYYV